MVGLYSQKRNNVTKVWPLNLKLIKEERLIKSKSGQKMGWSRLERAYSDQSVETRVCN